MTATIPIWIYSSWSLYDSLKQGYMPFSDLPNTLQDTPDTLRSRIFSLTSGRQTRQDPMNARLNEEEIWRHEGRATYSTNTPSPPSSELSSPPAHCSPDPFLFHGDQSVWRGRWENCRVNNATSRRRCVARFFPFLLALFSASTKRRYPSRYTSWVCLLRLAILSLSLSPLYIRVALNKTPQSSSWLFLSRGSLL